MTVVKLTVLEASLKKDLAEDASPQTPIPLNGKKWYNSGVE